MSDKQKILDIITEFLVDLDGRTKRGYELQVTGKCVYDVHVGNHGAYCVLKDLQQRIKDLDNFQMENDKDEMINKP